MLFLKGIDKTNSEKKKLRNRNGAWKWGQKKEKIIENRKMII